MKGQFLSQITTLIVVLVGIVAIIFAFGAYITFIVQNRGFSYDVDVINIFNHPYFVAAIISNLEQGDRQVLEHAMESSYTGSLDASSSQNMPIFLKTFLDKYRFKYYRVSLNTEENSISDVSINSAKCGDNLEGTCDILWPAIAGDFAPLQFSNPCNVGRIPISQGKNRCSSENTFFVCCKNDADAYKNMPDALEVVRCGEGDRGTCSIDIGISDTHFKFGIPPVEIERYPCGIQEKIDDLGRCKGTNGDKTPVCCAEKEPAFSEFEYKAFIPLFFKDKISYMVVEIERKR